MSLLNKFLISGLVLFFLLYLFGQKSAAKAVISFVFFLGKWIILIIIAIFLLFFIFNYLRNKSNKI